MSELIYLASPLTSTDPAVYEQRHRDVCRAAALLMHEGMRVFAPVPHSFYIARYGGLEDRDLAFWMIQDLAVLERCDRLIVLCLDGWWRSKGIAAEIAYWESLGRVAEFAIMDDWNGVTIMPPKREP